jgi:hypothetical protein
MPGSVVTRLSNQFASKVDMATILFNKIDSYTRTNQPTLYALLAPLATALFCASIVYTIVCAFLLMINFIPLAIYLSLIHVLLSPLAVLLWSEVVVTRLRDALIASRSFFTTKSNMFVGSSCP